MKTILLSFFLFIPLFAHAQTRVGVMGAISESIYKNTDTESALLPNVAYEGENFYLNMPEVGYRFTPINSPQNFAVGILYDKAKFDPSNSDDTSIQMLDDRDDSVMAFASYRIGPISTKVAQDISGAHDGYYAKVSAGYPIPLGGWKFIPSISYKYMDSKMSNHLFGVSQSDSNKTAGAIAAYDTGSISEIQYGVRGIYPISPNANFILGVSHTKYDEKILSSPIIEDNSITSLLAGFTYSF